MLSVSFRDEFLRLLREDEEFRYAVMGLLGISDIQSSLRQLVDSLNELLSVVRRLADDEAKHLELTQRLLENQEKLWEEVKSLREDQGRIWRELRVLQEGQNRLWEEVRALREGQSALRSDVNDLKVNVAKLWEENNKIWQEIKALREGQEKLWQEVKVLREDVNKLWQENNKIWQEVKALREDVNRLWEENNKIWQEIKAIRETMQKHEEELKALREIAQRHEDAITALRRDFNAFVELEEKRWEEQFKFNRWIINALTEIRDSLGGLYEYYTASWIREWLRAKGFDCDVKVNVVLPVDSLREVDAICYDPLVVGEATVKLASIEEADKEIEKLMLNVKAAEKLTGKKLYAAVLAVEALPNDIAQYLKAKAKELGIILVLGREYTW